MRYLSFFIQFNLFILIPILLFGLIFHYYSNKSSQNLLSINWFSYALFAFVGTTIHEISHYFMCLIFRYKINEVKLFRPIKGKKDRILGYVNYSYNKNNLYQKIGNFFVGIAPMIGGSFVIAILFIFLMNPLYINLNNLDEITLKNIIMVMYNTKYNIFNLIIFTFLTISISVHMSISSSDLKNAIYGVIWLEFILLIISIILTFFNINLLIQFKQIFYIILVIFFIGLISNIFTFIITKILAKANFFKM